MELHKDEVDQTINLTSPFQEGLMNSENLLPNTYFEMYQPCDYWMQATGNQ